jgi:hypothetical protein
MCVRVLPWGIECHFVACRPKKTTLSARLASPDPLFLDFIGKMLIINPDERLSATQVCAVM